MGMEQQPQTLLLQEQEFEEDISLLRKSSGKTKNNGEAGNGTEDIISSSSSSSSKSSNSEFSNGGVVENQEDDQNGVANGEEEGNGSMQSHSVYMDKNQGSGNAEGSNREEDKFVEHSVHEINIDGERLAATKEYENQGYQVSEIEPQNVMTEEEEQGAVLSPESFGKLQQEEITNDGSAVRNNIDEIEEVDDEEPTEYDVETVINKQNTHDLYCPNCQSCITKKVILRRKRRVKNLRNKSRRGKVDKVPSSDLVDDSSKPFDSQPKLDDNPANQSTRAPLSGEDEKNEINEQEVFRCLSCFSYFIPTGNGFKLFRCFGDSGEKYSLINPQETTEPSKNWFNSLFGSGRKKTEISEEGNAGVYHTIADGVKQTNSSTGQRSDMSLPTNNLTTPSNIMDRMETNNTKPDQNESQSQHVSAEGTPQAGKSQRVTNSIPDMANGNQKQDPKNGPGPSIRVSSVDQSFSPGKASATGSQDMKKGGISSSTEEQITFNSISNGATEKADNTVGKISPDELLVKNDNSPLLPTTQLPATSTSNGKLLETEILQAQNIGIASIFSSEKGDMVLEKVNTNFMNKSDDAIEKSTTGDHAITIEEVNSVQEATAQEVQVVPAEAENLLESRIQRDTKQWEVLKAIVYGGLMESITSAGVVSSAVGAGTATLNVFALGLANLVGGLFVIIHNLVELKKGRYTEDATSLSERQEDRYRELLGRRQNFPLHITVAILSYLLFGSLPPVIYGFSFGKNDDKDLKLAAVAGASLICIAILAFVKAHARRPPNTYFKIISQYVLIGVSAAGVSYLVGRLIDRLMENLGWFNVDPSLSVSSLQTTAANSGWAYY